MVAKFGEKNSNFLRNLRFEKNLSVGGPEACCRAFGSAAVTTCFNDLGGLLRLGVEHQTFLLYGERSNRLRNHSGYFRINIEKNTPVAAMVQSISVKAFAIQEEGLVFDSQPQ